MTTTEVVYLGELSTEATHTKSSSTLRTDAPTDNKGLGRTFSPNDLLVTSLASCMLTMMGIRAEESGWDISGSKTGVIKTMGSNPRRVAQIDVTLTIIDRGLTDAQRKILEKTAMGCPVATSLSDNLKQTVTFEYQKEN